MIAVPVTVIRVTGALASLAAPGLKTTVRWPASVPVWRGREVTARCYTDPPYLNTPVVVGLEIGGQHHWVDEDAFRRYARPAAATTAPSFVPYLLEAGLIESVDIDPRRYDATPAGVVMGQYRPTEAIDRGFLHYDHRWANDTEDPIADLAALVDRAEIRSTRFRHDARISRRQCLSPLRFEIAGTRYVVDDLWEAAAVIDGWLERVGAAVRLFAWNTRGDAYAFLARPLAEGLELARKLGDDGLEPASRSAAYPRSGDADYF